MSMFRLPGAAAEPQPGGKRASRQQVGDHEATVQRLRRQARRRLLGAAVLVGVGIVAFPLVFETQPRPLPMDLPVVIPSKEAPPVPLAMAPSAPQPISERRDVPVAASVPASLPEPPQPLSQTAASESPQAKAHVGSQVVGRFVVQVGAFADRDAARTARRKLEAKGLKTYTQVAKTKDGDRIRVRLGPYVERPEAERAAAQAKALGLAGHVLAL